MLIQEYWRDNVKVDKTGFALCPKITCLDGFKLSVQASRFHYCVPRDLLEDGSYSSWEIGFPSAKEDDLMPYIDDSGDPTDTVYGYVPTDVVNRVLAKHGGIAA
jgi:hypothetical protein